MLSRPAVVGKVVLHVGAPSPVLRAFTVPVITDKGVDPRAAIHIPKQT